MPDKAVSRDVAVSAAESASRERNRWVIVGLFALFFVPILLAYLLNVLKPDWLPFGKVNHGVLFEPAIAMNVVARSHADKTPPLARPASEPARWRLAYLGSAPCHEQCRQAQGELTKVIPSLGRRADRVEAIWIETSEAPGKRVTPTNATVLGVYTALTGLAEIEAVATPPLILLIDPRGFGVLHYPSDAKAAAILKDLQRLLRISKIDR